MRRGGVRERHLAVHAHAQRTVLHPAEDVARAGEELVARGDVGEERRPRQEERALRVQDLGIDRRGRRRSTGRRAPWSRAARGRRAPSRTWSCPTESNTAWTPLPSVRRFVSATKSARVYRMTSSAPAARASAAFSGVDTVPMTRAPRFFAIAHRRSPTPPAAAWTRQRVARAERARGRREVVRRHALEHHRGRLPRRHAVRHADEARRRRRASARRRRPAHSRSRRGRRPSPP